MSKIIKLTSFITVTLVLTVFFTATFAQNSFYVEEQPVFTGGVVAGNNFAQVDGDNFAGYHKIGLNVGGIVYVHFSKRVAASMEVLFSQKGSKATIDFSTKDSAYIITDYGITLNYAEVPILINVYDKRKSSFCAGFSYSVLASSTENVQTYPKYPYPLSNYPFNKNGVDLIIGGSLHLWRGLYMNLRFQYSMLPIRTNNPPQISRADQYNNIYALRLMYLFE